jgi:ABC-type Fe3+/spermidine/putrescine transport system ATPase subunit
MLMDEPTRNLDRPLARALRSEFSAVLREEGVTVLYVTHDQEEAFTLADRIILLDAGRILAEGTPEELYLTPTDARTAQLLGLTTAFRGIVEPCGEAATPLGSFASGLDAGASYVAYFRPEDIRLRADGEGVRGVVRGSRFLGTHRELFVDIDGFELRLRVVGENDSPAGSTVHVQAHRPPAVFQEEA